METYAPVSDSGYTDKLSDLQRCVNSQTHALKYQNTHTHIQQVSFFFTSTKSGSAVSNMVRSVRKVPKYGIVPCIAPCGEKKQLFCYI